MNTERSIYPIKYKWESNFLYRVWNNGFYELWTFIPAGFGGVFTYPFPFTSNPVTFTSFISNRDYSSHDKELCCFNITTTSCEFSNFSVLNYGQGGFLYLIGYRAS